MFSGSRYRFFDLERDFVFCFICFEVNANELVGSSIGISTVSVFYDP